MVAREATVNGLGNARCAVVRRILHRKISDQTVNLVVIQTSSAPPTWSIDKAGANCQMG